MRRRLAPWLLCSLAFLVATAAAFLAFERYVGADAPRYFAAGFFPCPFHAGQPQWDSRTPSGESGRAP